MIARQVAVVVNINILVAVVNILVAVNVVKCTPVDMERHIRIVASNYFADQLVREIIFNDQLRPVCRGTIAVILLAHVRLDLRISVILVGVFGVAFELLDEFGVDADGVDRVLRSRPRRVRTSPAWMLVLVNGCTTETMPSLARVLIGGSHSRLSITSLQLPCNVSPSEPVSFRMRIDDFFRFWTIRTRIVLRHPFVLFIRRPMFPASRIGHFRHFVYPSLTSKAKMSTQKYQDGAKK